MATVTNGSLKPMKPGKEIDLEVWEPYSKRLAVFSTRIQTQAGQEHIISGVLR